ncbi:hypothetical protein AArcSl_1027 [Halalkaliarchaeum desulfuricum]|uniref:Uncharacterized protein n=1 Tax=Halalkaliarchaeum desulfuricum TaxID=2055893 RepID=A0A343THU3_9EURY|nr:hypothetical protein [Halalkaliarchaeum desulfuricum]AUX08665.1 hypothetical protein AArcSl_1027 [Halalkaliarchaeum desulfuricum]
MPSTASSTPLASRRSLLAAIGTAATVGLAGCSAFESDESLPAFEPEAMVDVLSTPAPEYRRPAPVQPSAAAIDAGLERGDGFLDSIPDEVTAETVPDEDLHEHIDVQSERARTQREDVEEAPDRFRALEEVRQYRRYARRAAATYEAAAAGPGEWDRLRESLEAERNDARSRAKRRLAAVEYVGDHPDRTLLLTVRLEEMLTAALRLGRRRPGERAPVHTLADLARRTERLRTSVDAAEELRTRHVERSDEATDFTTWFDIALERSLRPPDLVRVHDEDATPADVVGGQADRPEVRHAIALALGIPGDFDDVDRHANRGTLALGLEGVLELERDARAFETVTGRIEDREFPRPESIDRVREEREATIEAAHQAANQAEIDPSEPSLGADVFVRTCGWIDSTDQSIRRDIDRDQSSDLGFQYAQYANARARIEALPSAIETVRERIEAATQDTPF